MKVFGFPEELHARGPRPRCEFCHQWVRPGRECFQGALPPGGIIIGNVSFEQCLAVDRQLESPANEGAEAVTVASQDLDLSFPPCSERPRTQARVRRLAGLQSKSDRRFNRGEGLNGLTFILVDGDESWTKRGLFIFQFFCRLAKGQSRADPRTKNDSAPNQPASHRDCPPT